jgi:ubiquinone/menaquinone biosynthesis C-methylase UbiE
MGTGWRLALASLLFYRPLCGGKALFTRVWLDFMPPLSSGRWLDVCCGNAEITTGIAAGTPDATVIGLDLGRELFPPVGAGTWPENLTLIAADAAVLPFPGVHFDRVSISLGLHHLPPEARRLALSEAHRVLKPDGILYVQEYNLPGRGPARWRALFYARIDLSREAWPMVVGETLRGELEAAGFEVRRQAVTGRGVLQMIEAVKQAGAR